MASSDPACSFAADQLIQLNVSFFHDAALPTSADQCAAVHTGTRCHTEHGRLLSRVSSCMS